VWLWAPLVAVAPGIAVVGAVVPATAWVMLVVVAAGRRAISATSVVLAVLAGALAAAVALRAIDGWMLQPHAGGPVVEELLKATAVVAVAASSRSGPRGLVLGVLLGTLVGIGFAAAENMPALILAAVQGGPAGLARAVYLRGILEGLNHAIFTGAAGAGLGWASAHRGDPRGLLAVSGGIAAAITQHAVWNAFASSWLTTALCNAVMTGGPCRDPDGVDLLVGAPLIVAVAVGPGALGLLLVMHRAGRAPADRLAG
jgi:RsiW-degrading membrane proteinase PrsW (M82 family)